MAPQVFDGLHSHCHERVERAFAVCCHWLQLTKKATGFKTMCHKNGGAKQRYMVKINNLTLNFCKRLHKLLTGKLKSGKFLQTLAQASGREKMAHRKTLYANSLKHMNEKQFPFSITVLSLPLIINTCIQTINKEIKQSIFHFNHLFWQKVSSSGARSLLISWLKYGRTTNTNTITYKNWYFKFEFPVTTESA